MPQQSMRNLLLNAKIKIKKEKQNEQQLAMQCVQKCPQKSGNVLNQGLILRIYLGKIEQICENPVM